MTIISHRPTQDSSSGVESHARCGQRQGKALTSA